MIDDKIQSDNEPTILEYWDNGEEKRTEIISFKEFDVNILGRPSHTGYTN